MIGKPEWFKRRKYTGWGITPKTWQGWVYVAVFVTLIIGFHTIPTLDNTTRTIGTGLWLLVLGIDSIDIMIHLKKDERNYLHEAISERNAAWYMVIVLALGIAYQGISSGLQQRLYVDPILLIALFGGLAIKAGSNIYLDRKD
ncbi:hypothetical protein GOV13_03155 [Candidatus Pacearchaeota archaeon]|nr:hypothetical protein [Candidatus Pacearchaeota archaeon]